MTDVDRIEEEINESNESTHLQRNLVRAVLALIRRLDFVITNVVVPYIAKSQVVTPEEPAFTHVDGPSPPAGGHPDTAESESGHQEFQQS